jgi:HEAT repeat protein
MELALQAFVYLLDQQMPTTRSALFDRALDLLLQERSEQEEEDPWLSTACRTALGQLALVLQQEERMAVSREEVESAIEAALPLAEERPARAVARAFSAMTGERGVLRTVSAGQFAFTHLLWQAYLAARRLIAEDPTVLAERLEDPQWTEALRFYAELGDMAPLVATWLRTPDDLFYTRLRTLSSWIGVAPQDASWRDGAMAVLARAFIQPGCPASARRALAEALAVTNVPGTAYFLKQALKHPHAEIRIAAVSGLARMAKEAEIPILEAMLEDREAAVREATVRALVYPGIDASKRLLARVLLEGDDDIRPVAAESLAKCGGESLDLLREVAETGDVMTRRAAVYGLAQVGARGLLEKIARDDNQWIVRSAASAAMEEVDAQEQTVGIPAAPEIEQLPWLISWAAARGESVGLGEAARQMLSRALREGDDATRLAAAQVLIYVGRPDDIEPLRAMLVDPDPVVSNTALQALAEIGSRYNLWVERVSKAE